MAEVNEHRDRTDWTYRPVRTYREVPGCTYRPVRMYRDVRTRCHRVKSCVSLA